MTRRLSVPVGRVKVTKAVESKIRNGQNSFLLKRTSTATMINGMNEVINA
jgi:hypothetical protein